jgi:hypothetical protein
MVESPVLSLRNKRYESSSLANAAFSCRNRQEKWDGMPIPLLIIAILAVVGFTGSGVGYAQTLPPFSTVAQLPPETGLTALPGLNEAQQSMAQSINNVCQTINAIAVNPNQRDLAAVCTAMLGSALDVQGVQRPNGVTSFGIDAGALAGALESLNGGAELVVPTSQSSTLQMQQTQLLGDVVEARLSMLRNPTGSIATANAARFGQLAQAPAPWMSDAAPSYPSRPVVLNYQTGRLGVYANGIGQFGAHDLTSRQNGY